MCREVGTIVRGCILVQSLPDLVNCKTAHIVVLRVPNADPVLATSKCRRYILDICHL